MTLALVLLSSAAAAQDSEESDDDVRSGVDSDFIDTRLTAAFGDDNILGPTEESLPLSTLPNFSDRAAYQLFYDNLNTRFTSRETLTHLVLYRELPAFLRDVTTEAALVFRIDASAPFFQDTGSFLGIRYNPWVDAPDDGLRVTIFPLNSDRFRVGYLFDISQSGFENVFTISGLGGLSGEGGLLRSPGLRFEFERGVFGATLGFKTSLANTAGTVSAEGAQIRLAETQYGFLGGAFVDLFGDRLRLDVSGGFFQLGELDLAPAYPTDPLYRGTVAGRISWRRNLDLAPSLDVRLYRNDPNEPFLAFAPTRYVPGQLGYLLSVEGTWLTQRVADSDRPGVAGAPGPLENEPGFAGAAQFRLQYDYLRVELTGLLRDLSFVLKNSDGLPQATSIPDDANPTIEWFVAATADYHFPDARLTLGVSGGLQFPASFEEAQAEGSVVTVVPQNGRSVQLSLNDEVEPVVQSRIHARWDLSEMLYTRAWIQYVYDPNGGVLVITQGEDTQQVEVDPHRFGFGLSAAARF
ncbi:MAG: hypothetical protein AAGF12_10915 [Myxococcota bacterium]